MEFIKKRWPFLVAGGLLLYLVLRGRQGAATAQAARISPPPAEIQPATTYGDVYADLLKAAGDNQGAIPSENAVIIPGASQPIGIQTPSAPVQVAAGELVGPLPAATPPPAIGGYTPIMGPISPEFNTLTNPALLPAVNAERTRVGLPELQPGEAFAVRRPNLGIGRR